MGKQHPNHDEAMRFAESAAQLVFDKRKKKSNPNQVEVHLNRETLKQICAAAYAAGIDRIAKSK